MVLRADDTVVLLEVSRCGTLLGAASALGVDHSTVSRRLNALEQELGGAVVIRSAHGCRLTDLGREILEAAERIEQALADVRDRSVRSTGSAQLRGLLQVSSVDAFGVDIAAPVLAQMQSQHPELAVEFVTATRPLLGTTGADVEISVIAPGPPPEGTVCLGEYRLGIYASDEYLTRHGRPASRAELPAHRMIFYIEPLMSVGPLQVIQREFADCTLGFASTNVFAHFAATKAGSGIGLLPAYLADREACLTRLLPDEVSVPLHYVALLAPRARRRRAAQLYLGALQQEVDRRRSQLLGLRTTS
ncbi:MAG TPA: LysR family transcriptional regulator [Jatrophihabitans sp.]|jgi:DNA-binding transcriptional LysR family regulator|uniref:LysR family transcriptional regulator n=1 Tax=Jatrophihabitans sp. TaxID=1932789 RepID=UPI002E02BBFA|nr:LysR family transcriptional regulator [Jatrophihabitans sp.]